MKQSDDKIAQLLQAMFPGDDARGAPGFAASGAAATFERRFDRMADFAALLDGDEGEADDINARLKSLKTRDGELLGRFIETAILAYFSAPSVTVPLTGKPSPLFPHGAVLKETEFALLEPVLENAKGRGE